MGVAASSDGAKLVAIDEGTNGNVWTSSDSGQTWEERDITGDGSANLKVVASSAMKQNHGGWLSGGTLGIHKCWQELGQEHNKKMQNGALSAPLQMVQD